MKTIFLLIMILGCSSSNNDDSEKIKNNVDKFQVNQATMHFVGNEKEEFFFMEVVSIKKYQNGKKHGDWIFYDNDGNMVKTEKYQNGKLMTLKGE